MSTNPKNDTTPPENLTYEQAIERVESITDRIESGEIGIEESVKEYERAIALLRRCRGILDTAEQRITELTTDASEGDDDA